jgi:hypothetical protein
MTTTATPSIYTELKQAGWFRNFNTSQDGKGHLYVPVPGAPKLGGGESDRLWSGTWTKPDGTRLIQFSNMDRSVTTIVIAPDGIVSNVIYTATLIESVDEIRKLNII